MTALKQDLSFLFFFFFFFFFFFLRVFVVFLGGIGLNADRHRPHV
jgi:hypothetical protein